MRLLYRMGVVLALLAMCVTLAFADSDPAAKKSDKAAKNSVAAASPKKTPAKNAKEPKPAPPAKKASIASDGDGRPKWYPIGSTTGNIGMFTLESGDTLPKGAWSFEGSANKFGRMPGSSTILEEGIGVSTGLTDRLTLFFQFDPERHVHVDTPSQLSLDTPTTGCPSACVFPQFDHTIYRSVFPLPGAAPGYLEDFPFASGEGGGPGEVIAGVKWNIWSESRGSTVSLSVKNQFYIPTRSGINDLLNNQTQTGEFSDLAGMEVSKLLFHKSTMAMANWGIRFTRDPRFAGQRLMSQADQMSLGAGFIAFPDRRFQLMSEYNSLFFYGSHTQNTSDGARDPVDTVSGLRLYLTRWMAVDLGYRYMLNLKNDLDRNGFVIKVGASYLPEKIITPDSVAASCSVDKDTVMEGSNEVVFAMAKGTDTYNYPLNYSWTASGGTIDGSGPNVRWKSEGTAPGSYTLTAKVDNGRGVINSCTADVTVKAKPNPPPTMSCSVDRPTVLAGERVQVTSTVSDQTGTSLTYTWQSSGGQIVGNGGNVQLDTSNLAPGTYTVTGRVENGNGKAADCSTSLTVQQPPPPPQASKINECFFKAASGRVDNVCKRVLDDVAVRLQNDPKATAVVIGYSDPKEPRSAKLANDRAANTQKYLSKEKGVAESRITVRSGTGQKGAGKQNQRIDVIWVPEGASY
ncbi:MAG: OmpA family protein [Candidatus Acidiferrales bacterium]